MKKILLLLLILFSASAQDTILKWKASDIFAEAIKSQKAIYIGYDIELDEKALLDLYTVFSKKEARKLNLTRFEIVGGLRTTSRRQLKPAPWYAYVSAGYDSKKTFVFSSHLYENDKNKETEFYSKPFFSADGSQWLLILDNPDSETENKIQVLKNGSETFRNGKTFGLFKGLAAFKISKFKSEIEPVITTEELEDLNAININYKMNGYVTQSQFEAVRSVFAKELAKKLAK